MPKPLPLGEVSLRSNDGEGKPGTKEPLHSDKHWLLIESSYRCVFVLSQHPCPLRRSAPAPPKGEPLAERKTLNWKGKLCGLPKPLPLGEVSAQQTERASLARKSRCAAMGRLFVRAILSLCQSCLAAALPSQALRASSPKGGAFFSFSPKTCANGSCIGGGGGCYNGSIKNTQ